MSAPWKVFDCGVSVSLATFGTVPVIVDYDGTEEDETPEYLHEDHITRCTDRRDCVGSLERSPDGDLDVYEVTLRFWEERQPMSRTILSKTRPTPEEVFTLISTASLTEVRDVLVGDVFPVTWISKVWVENPIDDDVTEDSPAMMVFSACGDSK